jgi:hypothetical protein
MVVLCITPTGSALLDITSSQSANTGLGYDIKPEDCRNKQETGDVSSIDHIKGRGKRRRKCIL